MNEKVARRDDVQELGSRVLRVARYLELKRRDALARHNLDVWEYDVLTALRAAESSEGLSPGELMAATQVASGTVTNRVDRLSARGFVSREPDPRDGRGVLVRLRPAGRKRIDTAARDLTKAETAIWQALSPHQQAQLTRLLRDLLTTTGAAD